MSPAWDAQWRVHLAVKAEIWSRVWHPQHRDGEQSWGQETLGASGLLVQAEPVTQWQCCLVPGGPITAAHGEQARVWKYPSLSPAWVQGHGALTACQNHPETLKTPRGQGPPWGFHWQGSGTLQDRQTAPGPPG